MNAVSYLYCFGPLDKKIRPPTAKISSNGLEEILQFVL